MAKLSASLRKLAEQLDRDLVAVPGGGFDFGLPGATRKALAREAGVHPDMLHFHSAAQRLATPPFWVDRYPVTRVQFLRFMQETGHEIVRCGWSVGWDELADHWEVSDPALALAPAVGVGAPDAEAYAAWAGKRLPSEVEWEKAARGTDGRLFPWGDTWCGWISGGNVPLLASRPVGVVEHDRSPSGVADCGGTVLHWTRRVFPGLAPDGPRRDESSHVLAGGSLLHTQAYSHLPTNRLAWAAGMQVYNTGFRCVGDRPPARVAEAALPAVKWSAPRPLPINLRRAGALPEITPYPWSTVKLTVPWAPQSMWLLDTPESDWGPFGGANSWPGAPEREWRVPWEVEPGRAHYLRRRGKLEQEFEIWREGGLVRYRMRVQGLRGHMGAFCCKTLSPQFSSQECLLASKWRGNRLVRCADLPRVAQNPVAFSWSLGELADGMAVYRSFDGRGWVVFFETPGSVASGNGWPPCTHLGWGGGTFAGTRERAILFFAGSEEDLRREARATAKRLGY